MSTPRLTTKRVDAFLNGVAELAKTFPTPERKAELDRDLDVVISFLLDFKRRLSSMPTADDAAELEHSISTLRHFVQIADSDPLISKALGLPQKAPRKSARRSRTEPDTDVDRVVLRLKALPPEELRRALDDGNDYTVATLRQLAAELNVRVTTGTTRQQLVEKIVKKIENLAGYEYLRDRA